MLTKSRITCLLLSFLFISVAVIIAARHGNGQTIMPANETRMNMPRRKKQFHIRGTAAEIASYRHATPDGMTRPQSPTPAASPEERELEDQIPKHVPLKAKIRKEKEQAFKDLKNEKWARDFELEVTNTGDKPIYEFYLLLVTDVKAEIGYRIVFPVYYGRTEWNVSTKATPEDIPIKPGKSCILKIHPGQLAAWELDQRKENRPQPKRIKVLFQGLSFGDGTGFAGEDGIALPRKIPEQSNPGCCAEPSQLHMKPTAAEIVSYRPIAQDGGTWPQSPTPEERELENKIPEHGW